MLADADVRVSTFDLNTIDAEKNYKFFPGSVDANGNYQIKMGKPTCDVDVDYSGSVQTGITKTTTFNDINWEFVQLNFDPSMNFIDSETKKFPNSIQALIYAPVFGKYIWPWIGQITSATPPERITTDYFTTGTVNWGAGFGGFNVGSFSIGNRMVGNKKGGCGEQITANPLSSKKINEVKGQKWYPNGKAHHFPGGADILFAVQGLDPDPKVVPFVLNRYNMALEVEKSLTIPVRFNPAMYRLEVEKPSGRKDYIMVIQSAKKYGGKLDIKPADHVEFIYINGDTFEVAFRTEAQLNFSHWFSRFVIPVEDGFVIAGPAGKNNKEMIDIPGSSFFWDNPQGAKLVNSPKVLPNFQMVKLNTKTGKVDWVNSVTAKDAEARVEVLTGIKAKAKTTPVFTFPSAMVDGYDGDHSFFTRYANGKIIISGQQLLGFGKTEDRGNMVTIVFDDKGNLLKYFIKPESGYARHDVFLSADQKTLFWANYDLTTLNDKGNDDGSEWLSKKVPTMFAGILQWVKINLDTLTASPIEELGKDEWAVSAMNPVVVDTDKAVVFVGREISKKAKNSKLVLVEVSK